MKFLIIQTAFLGDVVLATPLVEKLHRLYPGARIDFLLRKGNEGLLAGHPLLTKTWIWDKKREKYRGLWRLLQGIRAERYDQVINCQRFGASGLLTAFSGARFTVGFSKNPFSLLFSRRVPHLISPPGQPPVHEVGRNLSLLAHLTNDLEEKPRLYPGEGDWREAHDMAAGKAYVCIAPTSVWFTKQYPAEGWLALIATLPAACRIILLGSKADLAACEDIRLRAQRPEILNAAGQLSLLASAALMAGARMNYTNDSAPMHLASAMNAPVAAVFCSTVPAFGFGPLSEESHVVETAEKLPCKPCGLHGYRACPLGHFRCATTLTADRFPPIPTVL